MLSENETIDMVILGYAQHNVTANQDRWLRSEAINSFKLPLYFFMFDSEDYQSFISFNASQLLKFSPIILKRNFSHLYRILKRTNINQFGIGGFRLLKEEVQKNVFIKDNNNIQKSLIPSTIDIVYLNKIYQLCKNNKIEVILLSTPTLVNESATDPSSFHLKFWKKNMPEAKFLDYAAFNMNETDFADSSHLNEKGASRFTGFLQSVLSAK